MSEEFAKRKEGAEQQGTGKDKVGARKKKRWKHKKQKKERVTCRLSASNVITIGGMR